MPLKIALQMDPPDRLNPAGDSTIALALEAMRRGHALYWYAPQTLALHDGIVYSKHARRIEFFDRTEDFYRHDEAACLSLNDCDVVLMRQDPPYDMGYLTATYLLERLSGITLVANDPYHVRNQPEKLFAMRFPHFMPETLIAHDADDIRVFLAEHKDIVVKPLFGYGGHAVFRLNESSGNVEAILETLLASPEPLIAQRFLGEVKDADCRIVMIDGKLAGAFRRLPASGEIRANLRVGGTAAKVDLTPRQHEMIEALGPELSSRGLFFAGVDFIGDYLTEINITSPTGLRAVEKLYGTNPAATFWDAVENRL